ncbi:hypothetical protein GCM10010124_29170 [Pilimelia terevasa]|uniref:DUF3618 domain-containing protein n=1 Tax=Pilimelia terevasa TaxID=53372 RepID=A0A8J3BN97_9ACTN|nr:DUF3618 domain-containing protein [Pilimelia terevasa]GGK34646.1 hypothetical protein GCM10010124_29170 [Pilimelia terevasa]
MTTSPDQIRRDIDRTRASLSHDVDALAYKASPARMVEERKQRVTGALRSMRDTVMGTAHDAGHTLTTGTADLGDRVGGAVHAVGDAAADAPAAVRRQTQGNPLAAGLIAFGVGWLASSLVPGTDPERRAVAQAKDVVEEHAPELKQELTHAAQEVTDQLRQPAQEAVHAVKDTATQAADTVREDATAATRTVTDETRQAGQRLTN